MMLQRMKSLVDQLNQRVPMARKRGEEATRQALVLPLLDALGYDIWNPHEVCPEFDADFAIKKAGQKEKVDLAVFLDGQPRIYIEVKEVETQLDGHEGQLARYFNSTQSVVLGVLSNGVEYRFFTDTGAQNVIDAKPFHVFRIDAADLQLDVLARFHKSVFSPEAIREFATELNYTARVADFLRDELDLRERDPSERFIRWIMGTDKMYDGKVTERIVERFRPITKTALQIVLREIVRRSVAALDKGVTEPASQPTESGAQRPAGETIADASKRSPVEPEMAAPTVGETESGIVTTETELECFALVKRMIEESDIAKRKVYDPTARTDVPIDASYRDTTAYFAIYLNRPSWWVVRIYIQGKNPWVGFNVNPEVGRSLLPAGFAMLSPHAFADFRTPIKEPKDLCALSNLVLQCCRNIIAERSRKP